MSELSNCPKCNADLNGKDIYQHFLDEYTENGIPDYCKSVDEMLKSAKEYPSLYSDIPSKKELKAMTPLEFAAYQTAHSYGWSKAKPNCFRKECGIEISGYYDGIALYKCPSCNHVWKRFEWVSDEVLNNFNKGK